MTNLSTLQTQSFEIPSLPAATAPLSAPVPTWWMAPCGECSCGSRGCDITAEIQYLGFNRWSLPEHWSATPLGFRGSPCRTRWRITDAQGRPHSVCSEG